MTSLNARIGLSAAAVLAIFIVLTALALDRAFRDSAAAAMQERLRAQLYLVMAAAEVDRRGRVKMPERLAEPRLALPESGLYAMVRGEDGTSLWRSPSAVGVELPPGESLAVGAERFERRGEAYFVYDLGLEWEVRGRSFPLTFSVAEELTPFEAQLARYRRGLWGWLGAMAGLLLVTQAVVLRWGLRPLRTVAGELQSIEAGGQDSLQKDYPKELAGLTENLNALLRHERAQQARYKDALGDLAHSLKTPLAVLRGALGETADRELEGALEEQVVRMDGIVQYQLQRAATSGRSALMAPLPVNDIVRRIIDSLDKVHREKGVQITVEVDEGVQVRGNEGDVMELFGNLLDNAYKWCRQQVAVAVTCTQGSLHAMVEDDGPGISPEQAAEILKRGVRMDESTPGHGIGLAMVRDIVEAYDGAIEILNSELGGAGIHVRLPGC